jgi:PAS domain S-box-containing protein
MIKIDQDALKITVIYVLVGSMWILFSDYLTFSISSDPQFITNVSILKGWIFMVFSGAMLYSLIKRLLEKVAQTKKESEENYREIFNAANDGIIVHNAEDGNIIDCNEKACELNGCSHEELIVGKLSVSGVGAPSYSANEAKKWMVLAAAGEPQLFELLIHAHDGINLWVEVNLKLALIGKERCILAILRDISERKKNESELFQSQEQLRDYAHSLIDMNTILEKEVLERRVAEEALVKTKEEAERANVSKSQFLANMSHEIRTPMNGIMGMTDLTLMTDMTEEQRTYLEIVKTSTKSLLRVLNDILDYSKIEAGKLSLESLPFKLSEVIDDVVALFFVVAKQKEVTIVTNISAEIPPILIGDSFRLRQVLSNLLGNAVKFTAAGKIQIDVTCEEVHEGVIQLKFVVLDTGIGIPDDKLHLLFESFSQVDGSNTRSFGGTGLGLAISKKLTKLMGGEIWVKSKEGEGSEFCFTGLFGVEDKRAFGDYDTNCNVLLKMIAKKSVLLVEDDEVSRDIVSILLRKKGLEIYIAKNGKDAIEMFEKEKVDLILMDINMPYMDGYEAVNVIREKEKEKEMGGSTPIIAMTAYALKGDREKCIAGGMDDYLSKPIDLNQLSLHIDKWIADNTF